LSFRGGDEIQQLFEHPHKTRYRRPIKDFTNVIRAIIGMMFYNGL